ncbi:6349_t:CDS:2, partial [Acaulospora morrowiae]
LVTNYQGPISVTIHVNDDEESRDKLLSSLHVLYDSNPYMKKFVDVHLVVDKFERQFNMWRNVAKFFSRTNYVMMLDVDFHPCTNFRKTILESPEIMRKLRAGNTALVVPAFEYVKLKEGLDYTTFPKKKKDLLELVNSKRIDMFHASWKPGHGSSNYSFWYRTDKIYEVTKYHYQYEPYVIFPKDSVWCDERFVGYGANKAACLFELYLSGVDYWVLPEDFLIHQTHEYLEHARKHERRLNRKLYDNFREELCFRYSKNFILNGEWNTSKADNLKETCHKIRGFSQAIKYFAS